MTLFGLFLAVGMANSQSRSFTVKENGVDVTVHEVTPLEPDETSKHMRSPIYFVPAMVVYLSGWVLIWVKTSKKIKPS